MQDQKTAKLRSLSPLGILDEDKDTKLDEMLDDKLTKDDDRQTESKDDTDKDPKSTAKENDGDKTI